jgi:hypothetical protein
LVLATAVRTGGFGGAHVTWTTLVGVAEHAGRPDLTGLTYEATSLVVPAPGDGPGNWAGAASAVLDGETYWLAYRVRRPLDEGRGVTVVLSASGDGVSFEPVATVSRDRFGSASLERPALVRRPDGGWRLYVSCASEGSKHWWVAALDAGRVEDLAAADPVTVLPGDAATAVKDPVVHVDGAGWRMWVCCHPLTEPGEEDRMTTRVAVSDDGLRWDLGPVVLAPRPGEWDARGARVTAVVGSGVGALVLYDGRASAAENWDERTGVAVADADGVLHPTAGPTGSPHGRHGFRYVSLVALPGGRWRAYVEAARPDGAHDLRTTVLEPGAIPAQPVG